MSEAFKLTDRHGALTTENTPPTPPKNHSCRTSPQVAVQLRHALGRQSFEKLLLRTRGVPIQRLAKEEEVLLH